MKEKLYLVKITERTQLDISKAVVILRQNEGLKVTRGSVCGAAVKMYLDKLKENTK